MRDTQNIREVISLSPDYMGFIFHENSPRHAGNQLDEALLKDFPKSIRKVGVFVNADPAEVKSKFSRFGLDYVQLHGEEPVEYVASLFAVGIKVIKAFGIGTSFDFAQLKPYHPYVDFFLFDTKGKSGGGTGRKFDWEILKNYDRQDPFFLSGGISPSDIRQLKSSPYNIHAIDVNSKFELKPGLKDIAKLKQLKKIVNEY